MHKKHTLFMSFQIWVKMFGYETRTLSQLCEKPRQLTQVYQGTRTVGLLISN